MNLEIGGLESVMPRWFKNCSKGKSMFEFSNKTAPEKRWFKYSDMHPGFLNKNKPKRTLYARCFKLTINKKTNQKEITKDQEDRINDCTSDDTVAKVTKKKINQLKNQE